MIPLSLPNLNGNENKYVKDCIDTGWVSTAGKYVSQFEDEFAKFIGNKSAVSTVNGTAALHIALNMAGVKPNDLVIMPNVTFVASANAIAYTGATPLLIDINKNTWQMDLDLLVNFIEEDCKLVNDKELVHIKTNKKISAIMIVHIQGGMTDMNKLTSIINKYNIPLVEDSAEALGSTFNNINAGKFGDYGCYSFNGNKIMTTGGGGMIVSKSSSNLERARHSVTTAKTDPLRYFHDEVGYNYRLVNILAAVGLAQLEQLSGFIKRKREIAKFYTDNLKGVGDVSFQQYEKNVNPNQWLFTISSFRMEGLLNFLNNNGVMSRPFWTPMNQLPMYKDCIYINKNDFSREVHCNALSIPCSTSISDKDLLYVTNTIKTFFNK